MEFLSAPTGREFVLWHVLLLIVSLLTFWGLPTTAQLAIVSTSAAEGSDVVLHMRHQPPDAIAFIWYKGERPKPNRYILSLSMDLGKIGRGPEFSGREIINSEGSMLIKKVTFRDAGHYTVVVYLESGMKEIGFGRLNVYGPVRMPTLLASNTTVTENKDAVVLTCYTNAISTQWFFNGWYLRLTERMKLSEDHRILTIDPIRREDAGNYQCKASNPISYAYSVPIELTVKYE